MSVLLALASLIRGRPSWFELPERDWRRTAYVSFGLAFACELAAFIVGFMILGDLGVTLAFMGISPLAYCLVQSLVTDPLYRHVDAIALTLASALVLIPIALVSPVWIAAFVGAAIVAYIFLRSDGLALLLALSSLMVAAYDVPSFIGGILGLAVLIALGALIYSYKRPGHSVPAAPLIVGAAMVTSAILVQFDISF